MASDTIIGGNIIFRGAATFAGGLSLPANSVGNSQVNAASPIDQDKLQKLHHKTYANGSRGTAIVSDAGKPLHVATGPGTVLDVSAGVLVAGVSWAGGGQATVDVKKNGTTILSGVITINGSTSALTLTAGTISSAAYVAGDVFEVVVVETAGTGTPAQGLFVRVTFQEDN